MATVDILMVAGGGSGGGRYGAGGGGGGGATAQSTTLTPGSSYTYSIGTGATIGAGGSNGNPGGNTTFQGLTTVLGGAGGCGYAPTNYTPPVGGCGGGGGRWTGYYGLGTVGQGGDGGTGNSTTGPGGGGGGALPEAGNSTNGNGGTGKLWYNASTGTITAYYGGGGGGGGATAGVGGGGGGGAGSTSSPGGNATSYGGGGGGAHTTLTTSVGGTGYQGIIIIRYNDAEIILNNNVGKTGSGVNSFCTLTSGTSLVTASLVTALALPTVSGVTPSNSGIVTLTGIYPSLTASATTTNATSYIWRINQSTVSASGTTIQTGSSLTSVSYTTLISNGAIAGQNYLWLTVTNSSGSASAYASVRLIAAPTCTASGGGSVAVGGTVSFGSTATPTSPATISSYAWKIVTAITGASGATPTGVTFANLYAAAGNTIGVQTVTLTVTDSYSQTGTATTTVTLTDAGPTSLSTTGGYTAIVNNYMLFSGSATLPSGGAFAVIYEWILNSTVVATGANPSVPFNVLHTASGGLIGTQPLTFRVTDSYGVSATTATTVYIAVNSYTINAAGSVTFSSTNYFGTNGTASSWAWWLDTVTTGVQLSTSANPTTSYSALQALGMSVGYHNLYLVVTDSVSGTTTYLLSLNLVDSKRTLVFGSGAVTVNDRLNSVRSSGNRVDTSKVSTRILTIDPEIMGGNFWRTYPNATTARYAGTGFAINGWGYTCAGVNASASAVSDLCQFNPDSGLWTVKQPIGAIVWGNNSFNLSYSYVVNSNASVNTSRYNDVANTWSVLAVPSNYKNAGTSFSLNGFGYITGYYNINDFQTSNTIQYNENTNIWSSKAVEAILSAYGGSAFQLGSYVYTFGGMTYNGVVYTNLSYFQFYNDSSNVWIQKLTTIPGTALSGGWSLNDVGYVVNGYAASGGGSQSSIYKYDATIDSWQQCVPNPVGTRSNIYGQDFTLNGMGYACQGYSGSAVMSQVTQYVDHARYYVGSMHKSNKIPKRVMVSTSLHNHSTSLPIQVSSTSGGTVSGNKIIGNYSLSNVDSVKRMGCSVASLFPPVVGTDTWTAVQPLPSARGFGTSFSTGSYGYTTAGAAAGAYISDHLQYNSVANTWTAKQVFPITQNWQDLAASFVLNGYGYVAGGKNTTDPFSHLTQYNEVSNVWTAKYDMTNARAFSSGNNLNGYGYVVGGGLTTGGGVTTTVERYNDIADTWSIMSALPVTVSGSFQIGTWSINGSLFACAFSGIHEYSDAINTWVTLLGTTNNRGGSAYYDLGSLGYSVQGADAGTSFSSTVVEYRDVTNVLVSKTPYGPARKWLSGFSLNNIGYSVGGAFDDTGNNNTSEVVSYQAGIRDYQVRVGLPRFSIGGTGNVAWVTKGNFPLSLMYGRAFTLNGKVYHSYGFTSTPINSWYSYDENMDSWTNKGAYGIARMQNGVFVLNSYAYMWQGYNSAAISDLIQYSDVTNSGIVITYAGDAGAIGWIKSCFSLEGYGYSAGGTDGALSLSDVRQYVDSGKYWVSRAGTIVASVSAGRFNGSGFSMNGYGYLWSGMNIPTYFSDMSCYDPSLNIWNTKGNFGIAVKTAASFQINGYAYKVGGTNAALTAIVDRYNDVINTSTVSISCTVAKWGLSGTGLNNSGYIMNGFDTANLSTVQQFVNGQNFGSDYYNLPAMVPVSVSLIVDE